MPISPLSLQSTSDVVLWEACILSEAPLKCMGGAIQQEENFLVEYVYTFWHELSLCELTVLYKKICDRNTENTIKCQFQR